MNTKIVFRGMDHSDPMEKYARGQLAKIEEFLSNERTPISINLILEPSKVHEHHKVELLVKTPNYNRISHYEGPTFYEVMDRVIDVMYRELHEDKKKNLDKRKTQGRHGDFKKQR